MIKLTEQHFEDCNKFAKLMVETDTIYNRFGYSKEDRIKKLAFGKLGEVAFYEYLKSGGIKTDYRAMFSLLGADNYDFIMENGNFTIDIKTIEKNHKYILQPKSQTLKDYIVGVQISGNMAKILGFINRIDFVKFSDDIVSKKMPSPCFNCKIEQLKNTTIILNNWFF
jgi:hypothetical protein